jgi:hypothetical protein
MMKVINNKDILVDFRHSDDILKFGDNEDQVREDQVREIMKII